MTNQNGAAGQPIYRAFISYSHTDARFASWLHRKLEGYRLPVRGPREEAPRLSPVFIDRAELAAASDLTAAVRQAIANSAALVVVASPAARTSQWVAEEIRLFRELHPDRPVLAALYEGEPEAAFPVPLRESGGATIEPLAADFRTGQDGRRLGLLKIVAGLTGKPLDQLVQRDAQARQARVIAVTVAALILSLVLAALLVMALRARADAERQRAEAEGMVEFMLTDLRDKLKGVGRLDVMDTVNQRAMRHYANQDLVRLPDDSLNRRARLLHAMGEDDEKRGNFAAAKVKYHQAHRVTGAVLTRNPRDAEAIFAHAQSEYWIGAVEKSLRNDAAVERPWQGYLRLAQALAKVEPNTARSNMELGYAHGNLCEQAMLKIAAPAPLPGHCAKAYQFEEKALALAPDSRLIALDLANRYGWLGQHLDTLKRHDEAIAFRLKEAATVDRLLKLDPANLEYRERRQYPELGIGAMLVEMGRYEEARLRLEPCLAEYRKLDAAMPGNVAILQQHMRAAYWLARASLKSGRADVQQRMTYLDALFARYKRVPNPEQVQRWQDFIDKLKQEVKSGS